MRILVAINSFKSSMTSLSANKAAVSALRKRYPYAFIETVSVSDGGDGFCSAFKFGAWREKRKYVSGPAKGISASASYLLKGDSAYLEISSACGIRFFKGKKLRPMRSNSLGVGELLNDVFLNSQVKNIYMGLGGTASSDGGIGMASALGYEFLDKFGKKVSLDISGMLKIETINPPKFIPWEKRNIFAVSDVSNPLIGRLGSARVFSQQKGANPKQVYLIEKALEKLSSAVERSLKKNIADIPGGGAAGGLGAACVAFLRAKIENGSKFIVEKKGLNKKISACDILVTGEGVLDRSSFYGKIPGYLTELAAHKDKKIIFVCYEKKLNFPEGIKIIEIKKHFDKKTSFKYPAKSLAFALYNQLQFDII